MERGKIHKGARHLFSRKRNGKPKMSIVIPTLNEEKYITEALDSIRKQKGAPAHEIIIVDGGSTDKTLKIARKYADLIIHEPKRTVGAGRNTGMYAARGDILVCANADTVYPPTGSRR